MDGTADEAAAGVSVATSLAKWVGPSSTNPTKDKHHPQMDRGRLPLVGFVDDGLRNGQAMWLRKRDSGGGDVQ